MGVFFFFSFPFFPFFPPLFFSFRFLFFFSFFSFFWGRGEELKRSSYDPGEGEHQRKKRKKKKKTKTKGNGGGRGSGAGKMGEGNEDWGPLFSSLIQPPSLSSLAPSIPQALSFTPPPLPTICYRVILGSGGAKGNSLALDSEDYS